MSNIIGPERQGMWTVVAFVLALLAFAMGVTALYRNHEAAVGTQLEVLALHRSIKRLEKSVNALHGAGGGNAADDAPAPSGDE